MRFKNRALAGLILVCFTAVFLSAAVWRLHSSLTAKDDDDANSLRERSYTVETSVLERKTARPVLTAYGQVKAWTMLDLRAATTGPITALSANFRDGRLVKKEEVLFTIDPELAERRVIDSKAALAQSRSALAEAKASVALLRSELAAAKAQLLVRKRDLQRKNKLMTKRITTETVLDQALLAVSTGEQSVIVKEQALTAGLARIEQGTASVKRAELTLKDTEKALKDSTLRAPFAGRLTDVNATLGRRVTQNEKLGALIDPKSLEVAFPVRNSAYARLVDKAARNAIANLPVKVKLELGERTAVVEGKLDRSSAVVAANQSGRIIFAKLFNADSSPLRPGDFVTVEISEPELDDVAIIPAAAATADGRILVLNDNNRLEEVTVSVVRFQGDNLIVRRAPFGRRYVRTRLPFLAPGVLVKPASKGKPTKEAHASRGTASVVQLTEKRRLELRKMVLADTDMPADRKQRVLELLTKSEAPARLIERIERANRQKKS